MKKLVLTLIVAFATICGFAQEKVWEDVVTGYRTSTVFDVNKVWFYPDRTDVLLHIDFPAGRQAGIALGTTLRNCGNSYALKGKSSGEHDGAMCIEYNVPFVVPASGEVDILLSFEPLPMGTERFTLDGGVGWVVQNIRSAADLPSCITDTYWRNEATGDWLVGFATGHVIYDSRIWDIKSMTEKRGSYALTVGNGDDVLEIKVGKMKNGTRTITVGGSKAVKCSPITTATLPDYPVKDDRFGIKDNGYCTGDSVTIIGWLKDMPAEALQRGGNEFEVSVHNIISRVIGNRDSYYDKMDSLGRFKIRMPLLNSAQVFMDWKRTWVTTVLEPGETYFFLYDFGTGQKLFMGKDVRLQNELLAYPASFMNERMKQEYATQEQAMEFLHEVQALGDHLGDELQARLMEHPMLSHRYVDYIKGYILAGMGESLMQGLYNVAGDKLPTDYISFADSLWSELLQRKPHTLYRDYVIFVNDYMHYKEDNMPELKNSTASILKRLADEGKISLNEKEYATIAGFDEEVERFNAAVANAPDDEKESLITEFNNSDMTHILIDVYERNIDVVQCESILNVSACAISSVPNNNEIYDIFMAGRIWNEINNRRTPLPASIMEWAENNIKMPAAKSMAMDMQEKYLSLSQNKLNSSSIKQVADVENMSDGEKILRKLIEPYKGNIILIDVWGTWCSPCRRAMSKSKEEFERLAPYDVVFLYLANNSDEESWKNVIKEYDVTGENVVHYNLPNEQQSAVENFLKVNQYPTYRLIDRNGNLLDVNADPRNLDALENLLKAL